uniref:Uncharacterized protein n=1 Tax=Steinernema glaseri TaxID=37863 RepID=A0A1I7YRJ7_9BILA
MKDGEEASAIKTSSVLSTTVFRGALQHCAPRKRPFLSHFNEFSAARWTQCGSAFGEALFTFRTTVNGPSGASVNSIGPRGVQLPRTRSFLCGGYRNIEGLRGPYIRQSTVYPSSAMFSPSSMDCVRRDLKDSWVL